MTTTSNDDSHAVPARAFARTPAAFYDLAAGALPVEVVQADREDASHSRRAERAERSAAVYHNLFDASGVGLVHHAADGTIVHVNEAAGLILGISPEVIRGRTPINPSWRIVHPDGSPFPMHERPAGVTLSTGVEQTGVLMGVQKPDGSVTWISVTSRRVNDESAGAPCEVLVSFTDITELMNANARAREALEFELLHDPLTGLPNRLLFMNRLEHALARAARDQTVVAVLFVDLDDFKDLNDSYGHDAGDRTLVAVGQLATGALRPGDTFARLSGDEFVALCPDCTLQQAEDVAARVGATIAAGTADEQHPRLTASIGIALSGDQPTTAAGLTAQADHAMYTAKQAGRGLQAVYAADGPSPN